MTRRSRQSDRATVAARSKTVRRALSPDELRTLRRGHRNGSRVIALRPAPIIVASASTLAVIAAWVLLVLRPETPNHDLFTAVAVMVLLAGYLFQITWVVYVLPVAPLYTRLTITGHTPPRHSWTLWVLPATVPLLVLAVITPWSLRADGFVPGGPLAGVLATHLMFFTIAGLTSVLVWMLLIAPLGLLAASLLPHRAPGRSVFGRLSPGEQRWTAAIPVSTVGFGLSMPNVSDEGDSRISRMVHDFWELITLTGEPRAVIASWVFIALMVFLVAGLARSTRRAAG